MLKKGAVPGKTHKELITSPNVRNNPNNILQKMCDDHVFYKVHLFHGQLLFSERLEQPVTIAEKLQGIKGVVPTITLYDLDEDTESKCRALSKSLSSRRAGYVVIDMIENEGVLSVMEINTTDASNAAFARHCSMCAPQFVVAVKEILDNA